MGQTHYDDEAVHAEDDEKEEGIVIQEIQTGYTLHDRLLRPAMVGVSKTPSAKRDNKDKTKAGEIANIVSEKVNSSK